MPTKPLNGKAYYKIRHIQDLTEGEYKLATTYKKHIKVIIQEKVDGTCVGVYKPKSNLIKPIIRSGYLAKDSYYDTHKMFNHWVLSNYTRFNNVLNVGERIMGEWIATVHSTIYTLKHEPFVAFDIFDADNNRLVYTKFIEQNNDTFVVPNIVSMTALKETEAYNVLLNNCDNKHGSDIPEGVIYRIEEKNQVKFLTKYVAQHYEPGKFLDSRCLNINASKYVLNTFGYHAIEPN